MVLLLCCRHVHLLLCCQRVTAPPVGSLVCTRCILVYSIHYPVLLYLPKSRQRSNHYAGVLVLLLCCTTAVVLSRFHKVELVRVRIPAEFKELPTGIQQALQVSVLVVRVLSLVSSYLELALGISPILLSLVSAVSCLLSDTAYAPPQHYHPPSRKALHGKVASEYSNYLLHRVSASLGTALFNAVTQPPVGSLCSPKV